MNLLALTAAPSGLTAEAIITIAGVIVGLFFSWFIFWCVVQWRNEARAKEEERNQD